jgi:hypothetical protein
MAIQSVLESVDGSWLICFSDLQDSWNSCHDVLVRDGHDVNWDTLFRRLVLNREFSLKHYNSTPLAAL